MAVIIYITILTKIKKEVKSRSFYWRCILKIARTHFAAEGGVVGGQKSARRSREH
ncbi:MAG: hypothetical protein HYX21_02465 [Candidatus Yanofskybacteria bacterium]|nr:hypothetical protein [Candidatus Yanofskybacteria bacterium]